MNNESELLPVVSPKLAKGDGVTSVRGDRKLGSAWVCYGLVIVTGLISSGHWVVPIVAWLAPIFAIRFLTLCPNWLGNLSLLVGSYFVFIFTQRGIIPIADHELAVAGIFAAMLGVLPYWINRRLCDRFAGYWVTLAFPAMMVAIEFVLAQGPFGTWGSIATTQFRNEAIIQLMSLTGYLGLVFLMYWFAASIGWMWLNAWHWEKCRVPLITTLGVSLLVAIGGEVRVLFASGSLERLKVAGIVINESPFRQKETQAIIGSVRKGEQANGEALQAFLDSLNLRKQKLFDRTISAAKMGAKVVYWSEGCIALRADDEKQLIEEGKAVAKANQIYLGMSIATMRPTADEAFVENKIVLAHPDGDTVTTYFKSLIPPGEPSMAGDGQMPVVETEFGSISNVICFDTDFPSLMRQAGPKEVRIVFAPSNDWPAAAEPHFAVASLRAVENNYSLVRITSNGISAVIDPVGRIVHCSNSIGNDDADFVVDVPLGKGVGTIYAMSGDWLGVLCCLCGVLATVLAFIPQRLIR
jgi:apolipoprotein N-acyltransferase